MGTGLTTAACTKPACTPRTLNGLAPAERARTLLTRRAWPTAAQTAIVGRSYRPTSHFVQCPPGRPVGSPTPGTASGE